MDEEHPRGEPGEEDRLLDGGVAAPTTATSGSGRTPRAGGAGDTPRPIELFSDSRPRSLAEAPVATIRVRAWYAFSSVFTEKGRFDRSTAVTVSAE